MEGLWDENGTEWPWNSLELLIIMNYWIKIKFWACTQPYPWWRHQKETFSALLVICAGNSPVAGEFPAQRPVTRSFDVNTGVAGDLKRHCAHYDVIVMSYTFPSRLFCWLIMIVNMFSQNSWNDLNDRQNHERKIGVLSILHKTYVG